jgi:hypothetical protein
MVMICGEERAAVIESKGTQGERKGTQGNARERKGTQGNARELKGTQGDAEQQGEISSSKS